jgi:hypothetical protein
MVYESRACVSIENLMCAVIATIVPDSFVLAIRPVHDSEFDPHVSANIYIAIKVVLLSHQI